MITKIGLHKVQHGDVMKGLDHLMQLEKADLIYSDPPWGQGNLRYWKTINKRMTGEESADINFNDFISNFFELVTKYSKDKVILEYGCNWSDVIENAADRFGFKYNGKVIVYYKAGSAMRPCDIHFLSKNSELKLTEELASQCAKKQNLSLVDYIFKYLKVEKDQICLDPMCGMGFTAQAAMNNEMQFRGNELNKARLAKTIKRLQNENLSK